MRKLLVVCQLLIIIVGSLLPILVSAHVPSIASGGYWGGASNPLVSCTGNPYTNSTTVNPKYCRSLCDIIHTFVHVVYFGVTIAVFLLAPVLIAWGGIMIMLAGGNPGKLQEGKKIVTGTLIGIVITVGALLIVKTFVTTLGVDKDISLTISCPLETAP